MYPAVRMISPEPVPDADWPCTLMVTTDGRVSFATGVTRHVCAVVPADVLLAVPLADGELNASTMTPPTTPPPTAATMMAPTSTPVDQDPRRCSAARGGMSPPGCLRGLFPSGA
jgi:hypothetical protein